MEKLQGFCVVVFHGFVADEMTTTRSARRLGDPQQHPWPFTGGFRGLLGWLLVTACSLGTLSLWWVVDREMACCRRPDMQPLSGASKSSAALLARVLKHLASEKCKRFLSKVWGLTGIFSCFVLH